MTLSARPAFLALIGLFFIFYLLVVFYFVDGQILLEHGNKIAALALVFPLTTVTSMVRAIYKKSEIPRSDYYFAMSSMLLCAAWIALWSEIEAMARIVQDFNSTCKEYTSSSTKSLRDKMGTISIFDEKKKKIDGVPPFLVKKFIKNEGEECL